MKRIFALLFAFILLIACLPVIPVSAAEPSNEQIGWYSAVMKGGDILSSVYNTELSAYKIDLFHLFSDSYVKSEYMEVFRVKLIKDCTTAEFPHFKNANVEVDLNGHTWTVTGMPSNYYTRGNISISGGTMIFQNATSCPLYTYGGSINIRNVVFKDCVCGKYGLIYAEGNEGGLHSYTSGTVYGVGDYLDKVSPANVQLDNVVFENCSSTTYASCVCIDVNNASNFQINNCKFNNCHSQYGGAVYLKGDNCNYDFVNCEFNECYATTDGGAIYCESEYSNVRFSNCNAYRCHADDCGGFIFCSGEHTVYNGFGAAGESLLSERSNIIGCYALGKGGAFYSSVNASCSNGSELRNFNMVSNTAGASSHNFDAVKSKNSNSWGGAVCLRGYDMKVCYCDFLDNYGTWYGGAVYAGWSGTSIENCTFDKNRCNDGYGNDIYIDSKNGIDVINCTFCSGNSIAGKTLRTDAYNYIGTYNKTELFMPDNEIEEGDYIICSAHDERGALDIEGGLGAVNKVANVHLWESGDANVFTVTKDKKTGTYVIKSKVTGMVLGVENGSKENYANVQQWVDSGSDAQRWFIEPSGDGYYYIRCAAGQYMDMFGPWFFEPGNGANVQSYEFTGSLNQKWLFAKVLEDGDYILRSAVDEKYSLDIEGGSYAVNAGGANVHLWENGAANVFTLTRDAKTGNYTVKSKVTGLVLDVAGGSKENGANIQQWASNGTDAQRWSFEPAGDGYYYIKCAGGQYMDASGMVNGAKPYSGVNIQSWSFTGATNQMWKLVKANNDAKNATLNPYGDGTKDNPYKISNAQQLKTFAYNVLYGETYEGKYIELTDDILFDYVPIGYYNQKKAFKGHFDGNNHTVHIIDSSESWDRGLFSYCVNATVKNVRVTGKIHGTVTLAGICAAAENTTFENCINDADITSINDRYIAGICGIAENCKFISCTNNGAVHSEKQTAGGIAAYCEGNKTELVDCRNNGSVYAPIYDAGGMVGESLDHITFKRCVNNGKIETGTATASGIIGCIRKGADIYSCINAENGIIHSRENAAGMLAYENATGYAINIYNCANYGQVYADFSSCGGIVVNFNNSNMNVANCFTVTKGMRYVTNCGALATSNTKGTFKNCYAKGSAFGDNRVTVLSDEDCKDTLVNKMNTYIRDNTTSRERAEWVYWSVDTKRGCAVPDLTSVSDAVTEGSGTENDPYLVSTAKHLEELNNDLRHGINHAGKYFKLTNSFSYTGEAIGAGGSNFAGIFDGDYHTLTVQIEGGTYTGLFSEMHGGSVKNLSVAGSVSGENCVGGIVGHAHDGTVIDNCHVIATVTGTAENVGGIVGMAHNTTISNCRVDCDVTGGWGAVGGIAGWFHSSGKAVNCVNAGAVIGGSRVGGIIGLSQYGDIKIVNCSSLGSVAAPEGGSGDAFGGIIGCVSTDINSMTILNCFSKCTVGGSTNRGLIIGTNGADTKVSATEVYYVSPTGERITTGSGTAVTATPKTDANLSKLAKTLTAYASGKNEGDIPLTAWTYDSDAKVIYPKSYTYAAEQILGSGTKLDPYRIATPEHLIEVANKVCAGETYKGKCFRLTRSFIYDGPQIGKDGRPFCGVFDGNDHKLTVAIETKSTNTGLFSQLSGATVTNLEVAGSLQGKNGLGGIAGFAYDGTLIDNCLVSATVKGTEENCGGVVGMMDGSTVSNCRVDGAVTGAITSTGGIVGGILSGGTIVNCLSTNKVTGETNVGGILGCVLWGDPLIANCSNYAELAVQRGKTGTGFGGIIGYIGNEVNSITIACCYSNCKIGVTADRGYIVGRSDAPAAKVKAEELYYIAKKTAGLPVCNGTELTATATGNDKEDYTKMVNNMFKYAHTQMLSDITLTSWKNDGTYFAPKNYVNLLAFAGSVFGDSSHATLAIIGAVFFALITATAVLYVKKKKKMPVPTANQKQEIKVQ